MLLVYGAKNRVILLVDQQSGRAPVPDAPRFATSRADREDIGRLRAFHAKEVVMNDTQHDSDNRKRNRQDQTDPSGEPGTKREPAEGANDKPAPGPGSPKG
jgi:hypothetical protein